MQFNIQQRKDFNKKINEFRIATSCIMYYYITYFLQVEIKYMYSRVEF